MADVSNIRGLFNEKVLKTKEALLDRLIAAGFKNASYHCDGRHVWVCPDYVAEDGARRLVTAMEQTGLKAGNISIPEMRRYTGFSYG